MRSNITLSESIVEIAYSIYGLVASLAKSSVPEVSLGKYEQMIICSGDKKQTAHILLLNIQRHPILRSFKIWLRRNFDVRVVGRYHHDLDSVDMDSKTPDTSNLIRVGPFAQGVACVHPVWPAEEPPHSTDDRNDLLASLGGRGTRR